MNDFFDILSTPNVWPIVPWAIRGVVGLLGFAGSFIKDTAKEGAKTMSLALALMTFFFIIRIVLMLARAYVTIILLIIFAPIIITFSAAGQAGIKPWLLNLMANILVFPAVGMIFYISTLVTGFINSSKQGQLWQAPLIGTDNAMISGLFAIGMLMIIPEIDSLIKQTLGAKGLTIGPTGVDPNLQKSALKFGEGMAGVAKKFASRARGAA